MNTGSAADVVGFVRRRRAIVPDIVVVEGGPDTEIAILYPGLPEIADDIVFDYGSISGAFYYNSLLLCCELAKPIGNNKDSERSSGYQKLTKKSMGCRLFR